MKAILLDIEGTTTPIDFVLRTLFQYSKQHVAKFVETHLRELRAEIEALTSEHSKDETYTAALDPNDARSVTSYLEFLIDRDRKSTPLKSVQGRIWQRGYESGELVSIVFDDVPRAFERWVDDGSVIAIFSSGSVLAQQLLFRYTDHGDLSRFISSYFDTKTGPKRSPASYVAIADELGVDIDDLIFVSDIVDELDAARSAGSMTALAARPGNPVIEEDVAHRIITTFDELD